MSSLIPIIDRSNLGMTGDRPELHCRFRCRRGTAGCPAEAEERLEMREPQDCEARLAGTLGARRAPARESDRRRRTRTLQSRSPMRDRTPSSGPSWTTGALDHEGRCGLGCGSASYHNHGPGSGTVAVIQAPPRRTRSRPRRRGIGLVLSF